MVRRGPFSAVICIPLAPARRRSRWRALRCTPRRSACRIPPGGATSKFKRRCPRTSPDRWSSSARRGAPGRSTPPVHQGLHVRLEGDADLVAADFLDEPDAEHRMLEDVVGLEALLRRVAPRARHVLLAQQSLPAGHRGTGCPLGRRHPRTLARRGGGASVVVLAAAGVAAHAPRLLADHGQDGVAELHLAAGAESVDVAADAVCLCHPADPIQRSAESQPPFCLLWFQPGLQSGLGGHQCPNPPPPPWAIPPAPPPIWPSVPPRRASTHVRWAST